MFAITLMGTVPAKADIFDWFADIFANDEEQPAQPQQQPYYGPQPQPAYQTPRAQQPRYGEEPRGGRNGRRGDRRNTPQPAQQVPVQPHVQYQPYAQRNPYMQPRVPVNKRAQMKKTFMRNVGLVGVGLALAFVVSNTGLLGKINDLLATLKPVNDVNDAWNKFNQAANNVADLFKNLGNNARNNQGQNNNN